MIARRRRGVLTVTMAAGEQLPNVPAHLDVVAGAARPVGSLDGGSVDRALRSAGGAFRAQSLFHARGSLTRVGSRASGFDDREERLGLSRTYRIRLAEADGCTEAVDRLRDLDRVESVGAELLATAPLTAAVAAPPTGDVAAAHRMVGGLEALRIEPGDERVTVAVVDTGVSLGHPEFQRRLLSGYDVVELGLGRIAPDMALVGDSRGRDFSPVDDVAHGSHVAGIIGAQGWQVAPGVGGRSLLLPIRVLAGAVVDGSATVTGVGALGDIDVGLKVALDLGADVVNMSFGTPTSAVEPDAPRPHAAVLRYAVEQGVVLVAASGNSGLEEPFHPAAAPDVIAVGSVGLDGVPSPFTTTGAHVALCAPGEEVMGVGRHGYRQSTGTSHAAPFVSGAAALLLARARRHGLSLDGRRVAELLTSSARRHPNPTPGVGAGILDIPAALGALDQWLGGIHDTHPKGAFRA